MVFIHFAPPKEQIEVLLYLLLWDAPNACVYVHKQMIIYYKHEMFCLCGTVHHVSKIYRPTQVKCHWAGPDTCTHARMHTHTHTHTHTYTHTHAHMHNFVLPNLSFVCPLLLSRLYLSAQLYMGYVIYVSFATAFYVPMDFLEPPLLDLLKLSDTHVRSRSARIGKTLFHILFRSGTVVILCKLKLVVTDAIFIHHWFIWNLIY